MEREKLNKKQIIPLVIGILTLVILVSSATYAYFSVTSGKAASSTTITGDIGGDTIGTVTLSGGGTNLYLGLSAYDMSESKKGTTYYSSSTEGSRETNVANAGKATYTAELTGDENGELMYACDYEFTVTASGDMLGKSNSAQLVFEGDINRTLNFSSSYDTQKVSGTFRKITTDNPTKEFNAYLQLKNTESEQNDLAGTNLSVEISNTKWNCYLLDDSDLVGEAYALLIENGGKVDIMDWMTESSISYPTYDLRFVRSETPIKAGDTYNGVKITEVYSGLENIGMIGDAWSSNPWLIYNEYINNVIFEDKVKPISSTLLKWFYPLGARGGVTVQRATVDVTNLDISLINDLSYAFSGECSNGNEIIGLDTWDVSHVTNMYGMFFLSPYSDIGDISNWNVSNVTDMSHMFHGISFTKTLDLSKWDTSKVTNMSWMFSEIYQFNITGINNFNTSKVTNMSWMFISAELPTDTDLSGWNVSNVTGMSEMFSFSKINSNLGLNEWEVSKVTDMSGMFSYATINVDMDLSGWDISNVTNHNYFDESIFGTGTLTSPKWPTTTTS